MFWSGDLCLLMHCKPWYGMCWVGKDGMVMMMENLNLAPNYKGRDFEEKELIFGATGARTQGKGMVYGRPIQFNKL